MQKERNGDSDRSAKEDYGDFFFSFKAPSSPTFPSIEPPAATVPAPLGSIAVAVEVEVEPAGEMKKNRGATAPTDLLVCFPARQHLALMPKAICSPSRAIIMDKAVAARRRQLQLPAARSGSGGGGSGGGRGRGSPLFRGSKSKQSNVVEDDEPQSPKVTCAGQIKVVRPKKTIGSRVVLEGKGGGGGGNCRRWTSVEEEIERLQEQRKKVGWLATVGIRRDALPFLGGALRGLRPKVRCFGSLHATVDSSTDDDAGEHEGESATTVGGSAAASVFSKWLMVLEGRQEPPEQGSVDGEGNDQQDKPTSRELDDDCSTAPTVPPPNALLLMRSRSAPGESLVRRGAEEPHVGQEELQNGHQEDRDELVFMRTAPDYLKLSIDIANETWVVGGVDPLMRSRSWKR